MTKEERKKHIEYLLKEAKAYPIKGRYYVYERFKSDLTSLNPTPEEYEQAIRKISDYLDV